MAGLNEEFFFQQSKISLFDGKMTSKQVDGLNVILDEWTKHHSSEDDRWLACMLGTVHHETDRTFQPINEYGSNDYFFRRYDPFGQNPDVARKLGNTQRGDGAKFHGRGYVQLTGRRNYKVWSDKLNIDLIDSPELTLKPDVATKILFEGMKAGSFTGKKLANYFSKSQSDWVNARRIINGTDKAQLVAGYARRYYAAISYTT